MKTTLPASGALPSASVAAPMASLGAKETKTRVWFTSKHEHRGVTYRKGQDAALSPNDVSKLEKLGKITKTEPKSAASADED